MVQNQESSLSYFQKAVDSALEEIKRSGTMKRLLENDPSLWKNDPPHQKVIRNRLGWLDSIFWLEKQAADLEAFRDEIVKAGFSHAVLLGMGGSSLAPEVFWQTFGPVANYPKLIVLDSTDPDEVLRVEKEINLTKTLFIVSTKSGTTLETLSFYHYFREKVKEKKGDRLGDQFVAITDPGTPLEAEAGTLSFRRVFLNPSNIGGRFSVLSYFGMVPAVVMGVDLRILLDRIKKEVVLSLSGASSETCPGVLLGLAMAEAAKQGRNKLTITMSKGIESYGLWIEQLLAESLGKEGKGIIPIFGEPIREPAEYENDRLFIFLHCGSADQQLGAATKKLVSAGHPVIQIRLSDPYDLGQQFYRWAFATSIAGTRLAINPFDEPNVQEAKTWTGSLLSELKTHGKFPDPEIHLDRKSFYGTFGKFALKQMNQQKNFSSFLNLLKAGDYITLCAYVPYDPQLEKILARLRLKLGKATRRATMFGFGPRYLHSTGQLHKGGPNSCLMILMTAETKGDAPIPGQTFSFRELEYAQAVGDFQALNAKERRVVRFHLKQPVDRVLLDIERLFDKAFKQFARD